MHPDIPPRPCINSRYQLLPFWSKPWLSTDSSASIDNLSINNLNLKYATNGTELCCFFPINKIILYNPKNTVVPELAVIMYFVRQNTRCIVQTSDYISCSGTLSCSCNLTSLRNNLGEMHRCVWPNTTVTWLIYSWNLWQHTIPVFTTKIKIKAILASSCFSKNGSSVLLLTYHTEKKILTMFQLSELDMKYSFHGSRRFCKWHIIEKWV